MDLPLKTKKVVKGLNKSPVPIFSKDDQDNLVLGLKFEKQQ